MAAPRGGVPEWPKGTGCKPVGSAYGGSNPPAPIHVLDTAILLLSGIFWCPVAPGAGAAHYVVLRGPPIFPLFVEGAKFDVSFRVVGTDGTVLTSECFTVTVK